MVNGANLVETPLSDTPPSVLSQCTAWIRQAVIKNSVLTTQTLLPELKKQDESLRMSAVNPLKVVSRRACHQRLTLTYADKERLSVLRKSVCPCYGAQHACALLHHCRSFDHAGVELHFKAGWNRGMYLAVLER